MIGADIRFCSNLGAKNSNKFSGVLTSVEYYVVRAMDFNRKTFSLLFFRWFALIIRV